ncbi:S8 family peptidase [Rhodopirellula baltica]|uniref:Serine peptidase n=1 Tax=Rhodopirellula baltica SWK14 TaxID=993516 RepID=L7C7Z6_RHOBT|nr:S8 family peptidase [Rhodopirellula baltica]ELP30148.1 serine peptidase [Rhodopirellula baltica SWK14]
MRISRGKRPRQATGNEERRSRHSNDASQDQELALDLEHLGLGEFDGTVIYVHGIANKPVASILKCQWDRALFGTGMGQRSRMVYWVNRDRYPDPYQSTCNDADYSEGIELDYREESLSDDNEASRLAMAERQAKELVSRPGSRIAQSDQPAIADSLLSLARRIDRCSERQDRSARDEAIPLPHWARDRITRLFTRYLLNDVHDYFFDLEKQREIDETFRSRMIGGGPSIVIGHSLGSVIAYKNLCEAENLERHDVRLFLTLGSPLGLQEVQDFLKDALRQRDLQKPVCVKNWINMADRLDPVAADPRIANDIDQSILDQAIANQDRPRHPHSATGYLRHPDCQEYVRRVVGASFAQPISSFSIARDLTDRIEDSPNPSGRHSAVAVGERHPVLIELIERNDDGMEGAKARLLVEIEKEIGSKSFSTIQFTHLRRYLAAELTSHQIECLGPILKRQQSGRIWSNSEKLSLSSGPAIAREDPIQSAAAARVYGADGTNIHWAVLDTGIEPNHPHFQTHDNVVAKWDCTHHGSEIDSVEHDPIDRHGHGTHVAAIIAGAVQLGVDRDTARDGVAPATRLHSYKVLGAGGRGRDSYIIRALDHIASVNESASRNVIHGVNLSLGGPFDPETYGCGHSPICRELRRLWRQGVLVVVAAGNAGFAELQSSRGSLRANLDLSIGDPANLEEAIAVGSVHLANPLTYGTSFFSSRGPTADGRQKPDVVAPGERVPSANYAYRSGNDYIELSGTSMAAPHVSGLLSAFLSQRRELIGEPDQVKRILLENCTSLNRDPYVQGAGLPNLVRMLLAT